MQITNFWTRLIAFYWDQHCFTISHLVISWTRKMGDWASYFSDKILLTKIIYHSLIQFKILHRLYYSKSKLNKIVPNVSPICDKCLLQEATITLSFASKGQVYLHFPFFFFFLLSLLSFWPHYFGGRCAFSRYLFTSFPSLLSLFSFIFRL